MPDDNPSSTTVARVPSPLGAVVRRAALFALAASASAIIVWGATHASQPALGPGTTEAWQATTPSSQEVLSELRVQDGSGRSLPAAVPAPAAVTVVATPPSTQR